MPKPLAVLLQCADEQLTETLTAAVKTLGLTLCHDFEDLDAADLMIIDQAHLSRLPKVRKHTVLISDNQQQSFIAEQLKNGIFDVIPATFSLELLSHKLKQLTTLITADNDAQLLHRQTLKLKELGELIGLISHEVASPLGNVNTAVSFLLESLHKVKLSFDEKKLSAADLEKFLKQMERALGMCVKNAQNASGTITSFRSVAASQCLEQISQFYLHRFIDEIILSLKSKLKKLPHEIHVVVSEGINMTSDIGAFAQVISALINKSIRHGLDPTTPGQIIINAREAKQGDIDVITLDFIDNGKGISADIASTLFDSQHSGQDDHLSCAMLKQIVEQNLKGTMALTSEPDKGAHFTLIMPKRLPQ